MEDLWRLAPQPALRVWGPAADLGFEFNPAGLAWAGRRALDDTQRHALAASVFGPANPRGPWSPGPGALPVRGQNVRLADGCLLWLEPEDAARPAAAGALPIADLDRTLDLADISVWRVDLARQCIHFKDGVSRFTGQISPPEGLPLAAVRETVHPDDRETVTDAAREAARSDKVVDAMARYRHVDGQWRTLLTRRVAERDGTGRAVALAGVSLDVTELVAERERVLQLRERMQYLAEAAGLGLWSRDIAAGGVEWNAQMFRLYQRDPAEGAPGYTEWLGRHVHPLDRERIGRVVGEADAQGLPAYQVEFRILLPDGGERWVHAAVRRELRDGRVTAFGLQIDISEQRVAEAALQRERERAQMALGAAGIGVWERRLDDTPLYWNDVMYRLRGLEPDDPRPMTQIIDETIHPDDRRQLLAATQRHVDSGAPYEQEFRVRWPDGSWRWLGTRGRLLRDAQGRPLYLAGVNFDITARKEHEALRAEKQRVEQASQAKSEFMARMSHELRTPMNAVLGFAQLLDQDPAEPPTARQRERLARIRGAGEHLLSLIDDVLDLATLDADQRPLKVEPVALDGLAQDALQWVAALALQHGVTLRPPAAPLGGWVHADRRRLGQVLTNLLTNAVKYNRRGGWVALDSEHRRSDDGRGQWALVVRDSGRGLSAGQIERLFRPFDRLGAEREGIAGTGIGLAIVRQLTERLGGAVEVESTPDVGSTFRVWLDEAPATAEAGAAPAPATARAPAAGQVKVLCVEDNPINLMLVKEILALRPAITLASATDGQGGIAAALADPPQVLLLDLQLPDLHGVAVMQRLRAEPRLADCTMIALSANAMPDDVRAALDAGFDDYWTKPIEFSRFLAGIDALIERHGPGVR